VCAYKTSGDDGRYGRRPGRRPSLSSIDVAVSSMSSLSRYNDATTTMSLMRQRRGIISMSKRSRRRRVVAFVNIIIKTTTMTFDVVPRQRVVDNAVDAMTKTSATTSSLSRDDNDDRTIAKMSCHRRCRDNVTSLFCRRRCGRHLHFIDVVVATLSLRYRRHDDIDTSTS